MKKKILRNIAISFGVLLVFGCITYGINTLNSGFKTTTSNVQISAHNACQEVSHIGTNAYFVPTKTDTEWTAFRDNPPSEASLSDCCTPIFDSIVILSSCSNGGGIPAACPGGYTQTNYDNFDRADCIGETRSGNTRYSAQSRTCSVTVAGTCGEVESCITYPEHSFSRTDECGLPANQLGCPVGYTGTITTGTCVRGGEDKTRFTRVCTKPAYTICSYN